MRQPSHLTVACVVEKDGHFLMVEERDKRSGEMVFNQPAGHVEANETLFEAAIRETREETGWEVDLIATLGVALYNPPGTDELYCRTAFLARPIQQLPAASIDPDIHAVHWLDYASLRAMSARMRSPLVLACVERHRRGECFPLDVVFEP
ncbi:MAG: NUDIX hydrolase [Halioglobus sp.]